MKTDSNFSLDTTMDMDTEYNMNNNNMNNHNNNSPEVQMDEFNMIGFNDDFSTLGVMGALSRNSSDSLNLNSAFTDPTFSSKLNLDAVKITLCV